MVQLLSSQLAAADELLSDVVAELLAALLHCCQQPDADVAAAGLRGGGTAASSGSDSVLQRPLKMPAAEAQAWVDAGVVEALTGFVGKCGPSPGGACLLLPLSAHGFTPAYPIALLNHCCIILLNHRVASCRLIDRFAF